MKFLKSVLNRPKFQFFPVKFPVNRKFPPVTGSLKTASTTTQSFEFIGKGIESERPKLSSGFRAMMQSFLSKTPNSMHYSARSPQKFLLRLLKWDLEASYWCTILFRFKHWFGQAPITRPIRRPGRIYPRSNRPKPPKTRSAQTDGTSRRVKRRLATNSQMKST